MIAPNEIVFLFDCPDFESESREFESLRARQVFQYLIRQRIDQRRPLL
jgi:chromosomal replication initiation ATPase DnaA